ncbi:MAG: hypothetical protein ACXWBT_14405 [Usitatibacter sp.]
MKPAIDSREDWLMAAIAALRPIAKAAGYTVPEKVRASCGFPKGRAGCGKAIGQCFSHVCSKDGWFETFISPELADSSRVMDILVHEIGHATVGLKAGHRKPFADWCKKMHLAGPWTATTAGEHFEREVFTPVMHQLGGVKYPHAALTAGGETTGPKKQSTRMVKCECKDCGYTARTSRLWLETVGPPICPCNEERMEVK